MLDRAAELAALYRVSLDDLARDEYERTKPDTFTKKETVVQRVEKQRTRSHAQELRLGVGKTFEIVSKRRDGLVRRRVHCARDRA